MRSPRRSFVAAAVLALAGSGCGLFEPDQQHIVVTTDKSAYTAARIGGEGAGATYGFTAVVTVENRGNVTVYFDRCSVETPDVIYRVGLVNGATGVRSAYNPGWLCLSAPWLRLQPGAAFTRELFLRGKQGVSAEGQPTAVLAGTMVISYEPDLCDGNSCPVLGPVQSNEFTVTLAEVPPA